MSARFVRFVLVASAAIIVSACGDSGSSASSSPSNANGRPPPPANGPNVVAMVADGGPVDASGTPQGTINQAYVTVTVCVPGTTTCQNIDHVWVDTGSVGLRLFASSFTAQLPQSMQGSPASPVANCIQFVSSSYMWGAVRMADVKLTGESASNVPIQVVNDTGVPSTAPSTCGTTGGITQVGGTTGLGANGLLGVGVFQQDCGPACQNNASPPPLYYTCPGGTCQAVNVATTQQLQNVAGLFATDNNGVLMWMPELTGDVAATASGWLVFGINTQSNNALGSAVVFAANPGTGFIQTQTTYGDMTEPASYVDSGTNFWQFNSALTQCPAGGNDVGFYCQSPAKALSATMLPYNTPTNTASFTYNFSVGDVSKLSGNAIDNVGGPSVSPCGSGANPPCVFAWGLPFFYGRNVFFGLENKTINGNLGPFIAASTP